MTGAMQLAPSDWLPSASTFAPRVDGVIAGLFWASTCTAILLALLTIFILIRYRRGSTANRAPVGIATWKIETAWTVLTTIVFLVFFYRGAVIYLDMRRIPVATDGITVVGRQWMWDVGYPDGRREFNELHVRLNVPVRLVLSSEDVIHSFYVPAFRLKQDLVPGKTVETWFTPTRTGTYALFCAQYCGSAHAEMTGKVTVLDSREFAAWAGTAGIGQRLASVGRAAQVRGKAIFKTYGCANCHGGATGERAPTLFGLYGRPVRLAEGRYVTADEHFLHDAILLSPKYAVAGYALRMPTYNGIISEADSSDLIAYIKSLATAASSVASTP
jgi:cytochrome c oxidase subunit 2